MLDLIITYISNMKADENVGPHQIIFALLWGGLWVILACFAALIYKEKTEDKGILIIIATSMFMWGIISTYRFITFMYKGYVYDDLIQVLMSFIGIIPCTLTSFAYMTKIFYNKKDK